MCGYSDYNDPRLQPPEDDDDMTPAECWERCIHGAACMGLLMHLTDSDMLSLDKAVETMGCAECVQWGGYDEWEKPDVNGDTSDGYHTFNELYHHRAMLFSVVVHDHRDIAWKSKRHHDGTMYDGMFIVGIETPQGQATYHYDIDPYWDAFDCDELERAPEWDGHTPAEAIERIGGLARPGATGAGTCSMELLPDEPTTSIQPMRCTACGHKTYAQLANYCPNCGAEVVV